MLRAGRGSIWRKQRRRRKFKSSGPGNMPVSKKGFAVRYVIYIIQQYHQTCRSPLTHALPRNVSSSSIIFLPYILYSKNDRLVHPCTFAFFSTLSITAIMRATSSKVSRVISVRSSTNALPASSASQNITCPSPSALKPSKPLYHPLPGPGPGYSQFLP